jgi:hypothetical protein
MAEFLDDLAEAVRPVEDSLDADIITLSGGIYAPADEDIIVHCDLKKKPNVLLILTTRGGSPDAAYRIARALQKTYEGGKFIIYVHWNCKSAGTLITLGCDQLIMSSIAHLGPLDIQVERPEEIGESRSGLTPTQALSTLEAESWRLFESHFSRLRFQYRFPTQMAADVAAKITIGLFGHIYGKLEPMTLGENDRAMKIADHYGKRLIKEGSDSNVKIGALDKLIATYPSHSCVIDQREAAESIFNRVRLPTESELKLAHVIRWNTLQGRRDEDAEKAASVYSLSQIARSRIADKMKEEEKPK